MKIKLVILGAALFGSLVSNASGGKWVEQIVYSDTGSGYIKTLNENGSQQMDNGNLVVSSDRKSVLQMYCLEGFKPVEVNCGQTKPSIYLVDAFEISKGSLKGVSCEFTSKDTSLDVAGDRVSDRYCDIQLLNSKNRN